jgi:hypothetical protein
MTIWTIWRARIAEKESKITPVYSRERTPDQEEGVIPLPPVYMENTMDGRKSTMKGAIVLERTTSDL